LGWGRRNGGGRHLLLDGRWLDLHRLRRRLACRIVGAWIAVILGECRTRQGARKRRTPQELLLAFHRAPPWIMMREYYNPCRRCAGAH
jgi:hypothetical protein